jgi:hypothetical protein
MRYSSDLLAIARTYSMVMGILNNNSSGGDDVNCGLDFEEVGVLEIGNTKHWIFFLPHRAGTGTYTSTWSPSSHRNVGKTKKETARVRTLKYLNGVGPACKHALGDFHSRLLSVPLRRLPYFFYRIFPQPSSLSLTRRKALPVHLLCRNHRHLLKSPPIPPQTNKTTCSPRYVEPAETSHAILGVPSRIDVNTRTDPWLQNFRPSCTPRRLRFPAMPSAALVVCWACMAFTRRDSSGVRTGDE